MTDVLALGAALVAGAVLGGFYFGTLWLTVKRLPTSAHPVRLMLGSYALRLAAALAGFSLIMHGHWERLAVALVGFVIVRSVIIRRLPVGTDAGPGKPVGGG